MLGVVRDGAALGVGLSIADRAVNALIGPRKIQVEHVKPIACDALVREYSACSGTCNVTLDQIASCFKAQSSAQ